MNIKKEINFFINDMGKGGAEKVIYNLSNYFIKFKYQVNIFLLKKNVNYPLDKQIRVETFKNYKLISIFALLFETKKKFLNKKFIISHLHISNYINIVSSLFISKHKPIIVIHNHPLMYYYYTNKLLGIIKFLIHYLLQFFLYRFAYKVIVISNEIKLFYKKFYLIDCDLIYNPISDTRELNITKNTNNNFLKLKKCPILIIGSFIKLKNQIELIKSIYLLKKIDINLLKKLHFYFIGAGPYEDRLKKMISANNLNNYATFTGIIDNLNPYYQNCKFIISTSITEGMPNVLVESLSFNKPIIASNCSGSFELISKNADNLASVKKKLNENFVSLDFGILYKKNNIEQLSKAMIKLYYDEKLYNKFINNISNSSDRFSINNSEQYKKLIA